VYCSHVAPPPPLQWLLPSEQQRQEGLAESARVSLDAAEDARIACRQAFQALCRQVMLGLYASGVGAVVAAHELVHACTDQLHVARL
jgi:hypothetical protein